MGKRLSEAAGINIGCKSGNIVLPSEQSTYVYSPGTGVQAVMFYADREDQQQATAYLDELLTGEYTNTQIELCPIMKFCIKPGILSGGNQEKINFKMKKNQEHFLQNIDKLEILTPIVGSLDDLIQLHEGKTGKKMYTLRQMIMRLKNPMPATRALYPYLFYDVDGVGDMKTRFVYFKFLTDQATTAAKNLLALLQRSVSSAYDLEAHFTLKGIDEARRHPWSTENGGYAQGKTDEGDNIPRRVKVMCKNNDPDASSSEEDEDESGEEEEMSRGHLPKRFQSLPKVPPEVLRNTTCFKGLLDQGTAPVARTILDFDATSIGAQTREPIRDDHSSGASTIQTHNTMAPKQVRLSDMEMLDDDMSDNRTIAPAGNGDNEVMDIDVPDDLSALTSNTVGTITPSTLTTTQIFNALQLDSNETNNVTNARTDPPPPNSKPRTDSNEESADGVVG
jgi:hypothetical protein